MSEIAAILTFSSIIRDLTFDRIAGDQSERG
jgi:hypothetical protein